MSKRSYLDNRDSSVVIDEPGIQKHVKFWDRKNKGYITPLDTISGFITLGYSVIFSITIGAFVGVFLSLSTQTGWVPDPLLRSNVKNLILARKQTQTNQGAFDANGIFVPDKFDALFNKYAKSDKSGKTITVSELVRMTEEQERLGKNVKAWAASLVELVTAYFFIGHRGSLTREDVRAAYDGSLFYRLKDAHRLMIKEGSASNFDSSAPGLGGSYIASNQNRLSIRGLERRVHNLLASVQSRSSAAVANYQLHDWVTYIQDSTNSIREKAPLPKVLKRSPSSGVRGVSTPKSSIYRTIKKEEDPADLFPNGLTGVAKSHSESLLGDSSLLTSLLQQSQNQDDIAHTNETYKIGSFNEAHQPIMFNHLTSDENAILASAARASYEVNVHNDLQAELDHKPLKKPAPVDLDEEPLTRSFLRQDDEPSQMDGLTGVKGSQKTTTPQPPQKNTKQQVNKTKAKPESVPHIKQPEAIVPPPKDHHQADTTAVLLKESTITPPPEEKIQTPKKNNKKMKNSKPFHSSGIDTNWAIAADSN